MTNPEQPTTSQQHDRRSEQIPLSSFAAIAPVRESQPYLQIENIQKNFGNFVALRDIYLNVYPGEFICLLGPSSCGKTTLLRIICGLETQTSGRVIQAGKDKQQLFPAVITTSGGRGQQQASTLTFKISSMRKLSTGFFGQELRAIAGQTHLNFFSRLR